jgi:acyl-CoA-binding protein
MDNESVNLGELFVTVSEDLKARCLKDKNYLTTDEGIKFYGLFKQGKVGDCNIPQPSIFYIFERQKWNEWNSRKGMSQEDAMRKYCDMYFARCS